MMSPSVRRGRLGLLLVLAGLLVQLAASFFWSPATFLLSAGIGLPLVLIGAIALFTAVRRSAREPSATTGPASGVES